MEVFDVEGSSSVPSRTGSKEVPSRTGSKESRRPGAGQDGGAKHDHDEAEFTRYTSIGHESNSDELVLIHGEQLMWAEQPRRSPNDGDPDGYPMSSALPLEPESAATAIRDDEACAEGKMLPEDRDPGPAGWRAAGDSAVNSAADGHRRDGRGYLEPQYLNETGPPACYVEPTFVEGSGSDHVAAPEKRALPTTTEILV